MKTKPTMEKTIKDEIRNKYGTIARTGGSCRISPASEASRKVGYPDDDLSVVPDGANLGLGCGNPVAITSLRKGETVLVLGLGGVMMHSLQQKKSGRLAE